MGVLDYDTTPANNIAISGIGIQGTNSPAHLDDAIRQLMADIRTGIAAGSFVPGSTYQPLDSDLTAIAALTTTSFGRAVLALANAAALATYAGVGTGDSPQFTAVNLGHASDTTLSRLSAGVVAVEGKQLLDVSTPNQPVTGGATITSLALNSGNAVTTGTLTLDVGDCPLQHYTNGGAHTLAPGTVTGSAIVDITNNASAGAITTSGFTKVEGSFTTTNGHKFRCHASVGNGGSLLMIQALQ